MKIQVQSGVKVAADGVNLDRIELHKLLIY
jgi:hypothetical protein